VRRIAKGAAASRIAQVVALGANGEEKRSSERGKKEGR
jgi:hypothetical protein